ncbi:formin-like protein 10 [Phragmites australis]|uniref:formin-like protein 10 n=1 Tax=Phragmites australis TaxID=29695 RepID=UPI002D7A23B2|nr:formin-like protein 10 [Phragmites australis]XP_062218257.1 formin-like protein 10 [Phragmites australis]
MKSLGFVLVLVVAAALIKPSGGVGEEDWERFLMQWRQHPSSPWPLLNGDLVDKIWSICLRDRVGAEEILGNVLSFASVELSSRSSENALKTMLFLELLALLPPEKSSITCDCIRANYFSLGIPQKFSVALGTYLESHHSLVRSKFYPRRHLADQSTGDAPSMAPVFVPAMPSGDEAQFPQSVTETSITPSNSLSIEPPSQLYHGKPAQKHWGVSPSVSPSEKHKDYIKLVLIAVLLTAAVSFIVAFLIFYCCGCNKSKVSVGEQRDDHPLLHLQLANVPGLSPDARVPASPLHKDDQRGGPSKAGVSMSQCFSCCFKRSTDATPPSQVTRGTPESNATSDAPKLMLPPPPPPLPPKAPPPPPGPPKGSKARLAQLSPVESSRSEGSSAGEQASESSETEVNPPRGKLRPFYWDKVLANPNQSMAWHDIKFGSFHVNEDMIEELFGYSAGNRNNLKDKELPSEDPSSQHISLLNVKKSCNLAIVFKAMNVMVQEIHDALIEGNELPRVLLETILRMKPTDEEEQKLRLYDGDFSKLGLAEQVMKALLDIPFAFKRISTLLFISSLQEDASSLRDSFLQLEAACGELKHRLFLKLLEAVLKTGNRLNDGTFRGGANAFKLDTLLKLSDVKGADGKTTLLHFVVQEIIHSEGVREARVAMESGRSPPPSTSDGNSNESPQESGDHYSHRGLKIVSGLSNELDNVKRVAALDAEALSASVVNLRHELMKAKEVLNEIATLEETSGFRHSLECFVEHAEKETNFLLKEEKRLRSLVNKTIRYFHGNDAKDDGFQLFVIVRDFLVMLDKACKEVGALQKKVTNKSQGNGNCNPTSQSHPQEQQFPAVLEDHLDGSD